MANVKRRSARRKASNSKLKIASRFSQRQLIVFFFIFAAIGGYLLWRAFASNAVSYQFASNTSNLNTTTNGPRVVIETVGQKRNSNVVYTKAPLAGTNVAYARQSLAGGTYQVCVTGRPTITGSSGKIVVANQVWGPNVAAMSGQVFKRTSTSSYASLACTKVTLAQTTTVYINSVVTYGGFNFGIFTIEILSATPPSSSNTFYLSPTGSDSNPGTFNAPWRTFSQSLPKLRAGNTLYVRGGTYDEKVKATSISPGTSSARITVANYLGERPLIRGQLWLAYPSYWTVDGMSVTWVSSNPDEPLMNMYGGTGWQLLNSEVWGNGNGVPTSNHGGLLVGDGNRNNLGSFLIRGNCIHDNETNMYFDDYTASPSPSGMIEGNIVYHSYDGRGVKLGPPSSGGPRNVTVRYNTLYDAREMNGGGQGENVSLSKNAANNTITRNLVIKAVEANIFGFELSGSGNVASYNAGFSAPKLLANTAGYTGIRDGGGNVSIDPQFDEISCNGLQPQNTNAQAYGKYAL